MSNEAGVVEEALSDLDRFAIFLHDHHPRRLSTKRKRYVITRKSAIRSESEKSIGKSS